MTLENHHNKLSISKTEVLAFYNSFRLEQYLNQHKVDFKETTPDNPHFQFHTCPFCNNINYKGNHHPWRFYINVKTKIFKCHNCNEAGDLFSLLAKMENLNRISVVNKYLSKDFFESLPKFLESSLENPYQKYKEDEVEDTLEEVELPLEFEELFSNPKPKFKEAYQYFDDRGMFKISDLGLLRYPNNPECTSKYTLKDLGQDLDFRFCKYYEKVTQLPNGQKRKLVVANRIIFPVYWEGKCVGWQGRDITGKSAIKYYISENFKKTKIIYNFDRIKDAETITINEGVFDTFKCWSHNPTTLFGSSISDEQMKILFSMKNLKRIILALDPDTKIPDKKTGKIKFDILAKKLLPFWEVLEIDLGNAKDCGEKDFISMKQILDNAKPYKRNAL